VTIRIDLTVDGEDIAYFVSLLGSIYEAHNGAREAVYHLTEVGTENIEGCGHLWQLTDRG